MPHTTTNKGLHDFVDDRVLINHARAGVRAVDLGSGPGAMACRLRRRGCDVLAADLSADVFALDLPHVSVNFNELNFASKPGRNVFALATAIEVIATPIGFLRNIRELLAPGGVAVLTTPNVDSLPALFKFLLSEKNSYHGCTWRAHAFSPVFFDLLCREYLPLAGLRLRAHVVPGESILGDNHIFVLESCA